MGPMRPLTLLRLIGKLCPFHDLRTLPALGMMPDEPEELARPMSDQPKYVYSFGGGKAEGKADMKALLGGKGANLAEMSVIGIPVPPGFTITTEVCAAYYENGKKLPEAVRPQVEAAITAMEALAGRKFGDPAD